MTEHLPGFFEGTEMPTAGWWEALWPDPAKVLQSVGLAAGMEVIDLCSGDGWFTLQIARIARRVDAVDLDEKLLEVARLRLSENGVTNCRFLAGSAYDLPALVTEPVDFVFMANAFHGVPDRIRLGRAARPAHRPETVAATDDRGCRAGWPKARAPRHGAALSLWGGVRAPESLT